PGGRRGVHLLTPRIPVAAHPACRSVRRGRRRRPPQNTITAATEPSALTGGSIAATARPTCPPRFSRGRSHASGPWGAPCCFSDLSCRRWRWRSWPCGGEDDDNGASQVGVTCAEDEFRLSGTFSGGRATLAGHRD